MVSGLKSSELHRGAPTDDRVVNGLMRLWENIIRKEVVG